MNTKEKVEFLKKNISQLVAIHYSCQNLNDFNEGYSPRITSIAVLHLGSGTMHSFSIHLIAEIKKINRDQIEEHYDDLEAEMLSNFYTFEMKRGSGLVSCFFSKIKSVKLSKKQDLTP